MPKNRNNRKKLPKVNPELGKFSVSVGSFGELQTSYKIEDINAFLNRNLEDKKLVDRDDYERLKSE